MATSSSRGRHTRNTTQGNATWRAAIRSSRTGNSVVYRAYGVESAIEKPRIARYFLVSAHEAEARRSNEHVTGGTV